MKVDKRVHFTRGAQFFRIPNPLLFLRMPLSSLHSLNFLLPMTSEKEQCFWSLSAPLSCSRWLFMYIHSPSRNNCWVKATTPGFLQSFAGKTKANAKMWQIYDILKYCTTGGGKFYLIFYKSKRIKRRSFLNSVLGILKSCPFLEGLKPQN